MNTVFEACEAHRAELMSYEVRIEQQIKQYQDVEQMHTQHNISEYYRSKFTRHQFREVFPEAHNHYRFYAGAFLKSLSETGNRNLLSIGSGDGIVEMNVAKLIAQHTTDFVFELTELSPFQIDRAKKNITESGIDQRHFGYTQADLNKWKPSKQYAGVMAHHSLHHIENLEGLFDGIKESLLGTFASMDMIGRNGHMRWPEVFDLVQLFWNIIPVEKRKHAVLLNFEKGFYNHDCSTQGFEGIRAQDILPCLVERFGFTGFYALGGLIDPFVGGGFGQNYDAKNEWDSQFIDLVGTLNEVLLDVGYIKPTQMFAMMTPNMNAVPKVYKNRTPQFCIRPTRGS